MHVVCLPHEVRSALLLPQITVITLLLPIGSNDTTHQLQAISETLPLNYGGWGYNPNLDRKINKKHPAGADFRTVHM